MTERPKMNKEPDYLAAKLRRVHDPDVRPLNELVERWRQEGRQVPYADPDSCGVRSRVLFLHESPGPQASAHGSGLVSTDNNDPSAERFWRMASLDGGSMAQLGLPRRAHRPRSARSQPTTCCCSAGTSTPAHRPRPHPPVTVGCRGDQ